MGENNFRDVSAQGVAMLDQIRGEKMKILAELQSLGNDPQSMSKVYALQQELSMRGTDEQQVMDKIMQAQHAHDEFLGYAKGLIDKENENIFKIIGNIGK